MNIKDSVYDMLKNRYDIFSLTARCGISSDEAGEVEMNLTYDGFYRLLRDLSRLEENDIDMQNTF